MIIVFLKSLSHPDKQPSKKNPQALYLLYYDKISSKLMPRFHFVAFTVFFCFVSSSAIGLTKTGLDLLASSEHSILSSKPVGLICNQTSRTNDGEFGPDVFLDNPLELVALFSPEHGFSGVRKAGATSDTATSYRGIPVYSLYGSTRKPTKKMLRGIDVLVFDIQDIGVRPYTYLSTMILAMEAAAENKIEFVVLDRPNPIGGDRIEGNILDTTLRSFVGQVPIPYIHGMTLGEIAKMAVGERWFKSATKLKLTVIAMSDWKRTMTWRETGLDWTAPSPNIPTFESAVGAAMFGAIGELGVLSVGIGSDTPFLRLGSRLVPTEVLLDAAKRAISPELFINAEDFTVPYADSQKTYHGVAITLPKNIRTIKSLYQAQFKIFTALLKDTNFAKAYSAVVFSSKRMFEKVTGTTAILKAFQTATSPESVIALWKQDESRFRIQRKKYLLYQ